MSFLHSNDDKASFMNNRIPRKKTLTYSGSKSTVYTASNTVKQSTVATDTLSLHSIPRKSKDGAPSNDKKRTHDMSTSIAIATKVKKVKTTITPRDDIVDSIPPPVNDKNVPTYQVVKEGRVSGYPIIVSQVGSEHDAILLGCKENPQDYLDSNKDGKVKIRWKFAGYNGLVPTNTVKLKLVDSAPPIRKAAVLSGLLETGDELVATKDDIDLGEDEDDDAPILKAIRTELLDSSDGADKDGDYNDQEDKDEKLICYERSASVGYQGGKMGSVAAASTHGNGSSLITNQVGMSSDEVNVPANQNSDNVEGTHTEFNPQVEAPTVSASASESKEDNTIVLEFFNKLNSFIEGQKWALSDEIEEMIKANTYLLNATCPQDMDYIEKGFAAMEALCCLNHAGAITLELLYQIVLLGGKATDRCYDEIGCDFFMACDHLIVLLLSGYYPTKGHPLFLDRLADGFEDEIKYNENEDMYIQVIQILRKAVKLGDKFSYMETFDSPFIIDNINQLPPLEAGATHSKGGPMDELLKRFPLEKVRADQSGIKSENDDTDSVATDSMINVDAVPVAVKSDMHIKAEGEETDDDELKPSAVTSGMIVKLEGEETDDELELQPVTSSNGVENLKTEEVDTDDEMDAQQIEPVASSNDIKMEEDAAYECDTDNDEPQQVELVTSNIDVKMEGDAASGYDTDNDEMKPLEVTSDINVKSRLDDISGAKNISPDCPKLKSGNFSDHMQSHEKRGYYEHLSMGTPESDNNKEYISINNKVGRPRSERRLRKHKTTIKVEAFPKIQHIEDDNDMDAVVEKLVPKDDWKEMHEEGNLNMVATDKHGKFIAAKIARNSVQTDFRGKRGYEKMRETLSILGEYKPSIKQSENVDGSTVYDMIGKDCKDPLKSGVLIDYVFKEGTPDDIIRQAKDGVKDIIEKIETSGERVTKRIYDDYRFSYLSCLSKYEKDDDVLIYHFVFPEYKLKITMRSGDVIILNPSLTHSFSNCEQPAYLLSIFKEHERKEEREELERKKRE